MRAVLDLILTIAIWTCTVDAHGYLATPGARNSMWRLGFDTPKNYNDMGLNCGGKSNQWDTYGGKCGLCGDPYQDTQPRAHEAGGTYAPVSRPISRCYNKVDNVISVNVRITAHHKGYMEFRLCENNNMAIDPHEDCIFNGRLLTIAGTQDTRYDITNDVREFYDYQLDMPKDVTCSHCILHWTYNAGNSWGCDDTGCGQGLGPQEQFINCADIAILPDCQNVQTTSGTTPIVTGTTDSWTTDEPETEEPTEATESTSGPITTTEEPEVTTNDLPRGGKCWAVDSWTGNANMDNWCMLNCMHPTNPYCPDSHCACADEIHDIRQLVFAHDD